MITHVAIRVDGIIYSLPSPNRHHHILWALAKRKGLPNVPKVVDEDKLTQRMEEGTDSQGFLDESGCYLNRKEAMTHAMACGQIVQGKWGNQLYSEDVW